MSVIALNSSSRDRAWALLVLADGTLLDARVMPGGALDRCLPGVLAELRPGEASAVVVLTGPGSYSGVRAGMATALGLAAARSLPLHGVGSLHAIAMEANPADGTEFMVVADAGRGGVYMARFLAEVDGVTPVDHVSRVSATELAGGGRIFASAPVPGVPVEQLDPVGVLAATVPRALALPPLNPMGLTAVHAQPSTPPV